MGKRVLVTRPEPGASRTARRLDELGFTPVLLPLSETAALAPGPLPENIDALAVTSANALQHAPEALLAALAGTTVFAVGARTAEAARQAGLSTIVEGPGDAAGLASMVLGQAAPPSRLLYLTGRVRRPDFERWLAEGGIAVLPVETYDTRPVRFSGADVERRLGGVSADAVLLYSAEAAGTFAALLPEVPLLAGVGALCLSARIAAVLAGTGLRIAVAAEPTEDALMRLLAATG